MSAADNAALYERLSEAFSAGDTETVRALLADDVVWHLPGKSIVSGDHSGKAAVMGFLGQVLELTGGTFKLEVLDSAASDRGVYAWQRVTAQRQGKTLDERELVFFEMRGGKVAEVWHRPDTRAVDEFFS